MEGIKDSPPLVLNPIVYEIAEKVRLAGGKAYLVGGSARDLAACYEPKDYDIEVFRLEPETLNEVLGKIDSVDLVGESFSVWQLHHYPVDVSLPRKEKKIDLGHKGFEVSSDPYLSLTEACRRRDFTMNSMAYDIEKGDLYDPFGGFMDYRHGYLRHTSDQFVEDPLRVLRGVQFASRFNMIMAPETVELCQKLKIEYFTLPIERIWAEWRKFLLGLSPSAGLKVLKETRWIELYPELDMLIGVEQDPQWHPEGDVFVHLCAVMNLAAQRTIGLEEKDVLTVMLGALCHDLGKATTTTVAEDGHVHHYGHADAGVPLAEKLLKRIGSPQEYVKPVQTIVNNHMVYSGLRADQVSEGYVRRLTHKLSIGGTSLRLFNLVVEADMKGQAEGDGMVMDAVRWVLEVAEKLQIKDNAPKPILMGRHLMELKVPPGKIYSTILGDVYQLQLDGVVTTLEEAKAKAEEYFRDYEATAGRMVPSVPRYP